MYFEIKDLTQEERDTLQEMFCDRLRPIYSIYTEVCQIEIECTLDNLECSGEITEEQVSEIDADKLEELALELAQRCENNVFQEICEEADLVVRNHYNV